MIPSPQFISMRFSLCQIPLPAAASPILAKDISFLYPYIQSTVFDPSTLGSYTKQNLHHRTFTHPYNSALHSKYIFTKFIHKSSLSQPCQSISQKKIRITLKISRCHLRLRPLQPETLNLGFYDPRSLNCYQRGAYRIARLQAFQRR